MKKWNRRRKNYAKCCKSKKKWYKNEKNVEHKIKNAVFPRTNMVCKCGLYLGKTCKSLDYIVTIQFKLCISIMRKKL